MGNIYFEIYIITNTSKNVYTSKYTNITTEEVLTFYTNSNNDTDTNTNTNTDAYIHQTAAQPCTQNLRTADHDRRPPLLLH